LQMAEGRDQMTEGQNPSASSILHLAPGIRHLIPERSVCIRPVQIHMSQAQTDEPYRLKAAAPHHACRERLQSPIVVPIARNTLQQSCDTTCPHKSSFTMSSFLPEDRRQRTKDPMTSIIKPRSLSSSFLF
jgi:hypothetical protein